jgi:hypothetical protein
MEVGIIKVEFPHSGCIGLTVWVVMEDIHRTQFTSTNPTEDTVHTMLLQWEEVPVFQVDQFHQEVESVVVLFQEVDSEEQVIQVRRHNILKY